MQTTNCLVEPRKSYKDRIFTTNATGFPGVTHISNHDFAPVIAKAKAMPGFPADKPKKEMLTGFGHAAVLGVAPQVLDAVSAGKLDRFVLIGGCDGSESERSYYTRLATSLPDSSVILTLGCAKFRVLGKKVRSQRTARNVVAATALCSLHTGRTALPPPSQCGRRHSRAHTRPLHHSPPPTPTRTGPPSAPLSTAQDYGVVPGTGIPRVLDLGQCNDSYSAVVIAQTLAGALKTDINSLPLSIVLSWLEQKAGACRLRCMGTAAALRRNSLLAGAPPLLPRAVLVLLSLLHLGVKNIRIGPSLPAFVTPKTLGCEWVWCTMTANDSPVGVWRHSLSTEIFVAHVTSSVGSHCHTDVAFTSPPPLCAHLVPQSSSTRSTSNPSTRRRWTAT